MTRAYHQNRAAENIAIDPDGQTQIKRVMPITSEEIKTVIEKSDSFGFEMKVSHVLSNIRADDDSSQPTDISPIAHGETYIDESESKTREFDFRMTVTHRETSDHIRRVHFAIECKNNSEESPLIICGRPRNTRESYHAIVESQLHEHTVSKVYARRGCSLYSRNDFVGKRVIKLKPDENAQKTKPLYKLDRSDDGFDRWSQAVQSSFDFVKEAYFLSEKAFVKRAESLILPIVVVPNNTLWTVDYKESGEINGKPKKVDQCEVYYGKKLIIEIQRPEEIIFQVSHVHFLTLTGLEHFISTFTKKSRGWVKWTELFQSAAQTTPHEFNEVI